MRQIELLGPVDKRVIAYPLFKLCDILGKTLVVTDDANFRRFADNYETEFTVGRSDFVVTHDVSKAIVEDLGMKLQNYEFVIFISTDNVVAGNDCTVYCHGKGKLLLDEKVIDGLESIDSYDLTISTDKPKDKNAVFLQANGSTLSYVWNCEETKTFLPCKNADIVRIGAKLFMETLGIKSIEDFSKYLVKEV